MGFVDLHFLTIIGVLILWLWVSMWGWRWYRQKKQVDDGFMNRLKNYHTHRFDSWLEPVLFFTAIIFLGISLLGPGYGSRVNHSKESGIDIVFVVDVSKSMLAEDMRDGRSRLETAKQTVMEYMNRHPEHSYGLVEFAGEAMVVAPMTQDTQAVSTFIAGLTVEDVMEQGTDIQEALDLSLARFGNVDEDRGRMIVLVTDGGDEVEVELDTLLEEARNQGVVVSTVGVGGSSPVPIPEGKDMFGRSVYTTYLGEQVMTQLNTQPLREIAKVTEGQFIQLQSANDLEELDEVITNMKSTMLSDSNTSEGLENRYQWGVGFALLILSSVAVYPLLLATRRHV